MGPWGRSVTFTSPLPRAQPSFSLEKVTGTWILSPHRMVALTWGLPPRGSTAPQLRGCARLGGGSAGTGVHLWGFLGSRLEEQEVG